MDSRPTDAALEARDEKLLAFQRQAILGELTGLIVHEYNNLMTPVLARAQDALMRNDVAAMQKALRVTVQQTERALQFSRRLLGLSKGDGAPPEPHPLVELVNVAIACAVRPFEKDGIELVVDVPETLRITAQPLLFEQMLLNLLLNARSAMAKRGGTLRIVARHDGDTIGISIADQGVGMTPNLLDNVVNPFLAAGGEVVGVPGNELGLGLRACRMIARWHGARLSMRNNDGPGCTVHIEWPAA